ncbi:MAG: nrdA, partial [Patescibacteria group bacterium]|nr:nrdA [Patescibacteria group bacterium]
MDIAQIRKRDGSIVDFEKEKLQRAMEKAALAVNPAIDLRAFDVIADHALRHIELRFNDNVPTVEAVQDLVERSLMEYGLFDIAKAYILYRAERAKAREVEKQETVAMVEKAKLHYIDEKGKEKILDKKKLQQLFAAACKGFEESVSINDLVHNSEGNLYDGMSLEDLGKALVMASRAFIEKDPAYSRVSARLTLDNLYQEVFGVRGEAANFEKEYRNSFVTTVNKCVTDGRLVTEMLDFDLEDLAAYLKPERDGLFEYLGIQVLYDRYFIREEGGERKLETPQTFWMRVAMGMALNEGENKSRYAKEFYDILSTLRYVASTPTLFHSGTTYAQLSSCYLNTVEDDLRSIFKVYGDNAQLSKYSGGIGTDWTNIRGTGALIKATNVGSQGVVPFLKIANDVTVAINRSGKRRGATCAYLETWHYDIEDFLDLRRNTGDDRRRAHDMNTANWIPDLFMKRVIEDGQWTLFSPDETPDLHHIYGKAFDKKYIAYEKKAAKGEMKVFKIMRAKDLWRKMISMLFETGHPWVTFKDPSNVRSPQDHVGVVHNSNLCTEITLNNSETETAVCNLGSVNLSRHMKNGKLDTALVKETVTLAMRMLDNVIDLNFYPTVETKHSNMQHRPVGLGIMGFQDALYLADIDFDSDKAVKFADESMELISYHAIMGSALLAKEKGAYATFKGSKWDRGIFPIDTLDLLEQERGMPIGVSRTIKLDWKPVREAVKKYGMRNSNTMATAPTATISNISGCFPCIEPIYKNLYVKSNMSGEFTVVNEYLVEDLKKLGLWNETMLDQLKNSDGSVQEITSIPPRLRNKYKTVFEVGANWLIKIAAYRGKWIDQSQSLNIFFNGTSGKALSDVYMHAWHLGLKTTYYLRTMAATSIEKSSLDINKNFGTDTPAPIPAPIMHTVGIA